MMPHLDVGLCFMVGDADAGAGCDCDGDANVDGCAYAHVDAQIGDAGVGINVIALLM